MANYILSYLGYQWLTNPWSAVNETSEIYGQKARRTLKALQFQFVKMRDERRGILERTRVSLDVGCEVEAGGPAGGSTEIEHNN